MIRGTDAEFQLLLYREIAADVRRYDPTIKLRDAWVWCAGRDHWEFHFGDFYWHGSAGGAYDARAKGWEAYLVRFEVPSASECRVRFSPVKDSPK